MGPHISSSIAQVHRARGLDTSHERSSLGKDFLFERGPMFAKGGQTWGTLRLRMSAPLEIYPSVLWMRVESKSPP
jgi:hypothetical protein